MNNAEYDEIIQNLPFWNHLSYREKQKVISNKKISIFNAKQQICGGECNCLGLSIVVTGMLRAYLLSPEGREMTLYRIRPGEACLASAACVLHSLSLETHVEVEITSELIIIPREIYSELIQNNIYVECASYRMGAERNNEVIKSIEHLVFMKLDQRLASFLLDESKYCSDDKILKTHEQIATDIGSARETVCRALKNMENSGTVKVFRGGVELVNKPALQHILYC